MKTRLRIGLRSPKQLPWFMIWREYLENEEVVFAKVIFSTLSMRTTKIWGQIKLRAEILGCAITVHSQDDAEIVAEANREITRLKMENARLINLLNEMCTNTEVLSCSSM